MRVGGQGFRRPCSTVLIHKYRPVIRHAQAHFVSNVTIVRFSCASWRIVLSTSPTNSGSKRRHVGSSNRITSGASPAHAQSRHALLLPARQAARITGLFASQPDFGYCSSRASAVASTFGSPFTITGPSMIFSSAVRCGNRLNSENKSRHADAAARINPFAG